jgi:hypothetical protein
MKLREARILLRMAGFFAIAVRLASRVRPSMDWAEIMKACIFNVHLEFCCI